MKQNRSLLIGIAFISLFVGDSAAKVGQVSMTCDEVFSWELPFAVMFLFGAIFALGFFAGKTDEELKND